MIIHTKKIVSEGFPLRGIDGGDLFNSRLIIM